MKSIHYHITAIFIYGMAVLFLDHLKIYYYFERLMLSVLILYGLCVAGWCYSKSTKQWFVSAMLSWCFASAMVSFLQNATATVIYLSNTTRSLKLVEDFIYQTQTEWLSVHYFISGLLAMFVFFYFVINWEKWLEV